MVISEGLHEARKIGGSCEVGKPGPNGGFLGRALGEAVLCCAGE